MAEDDVTRHSEAEIASLATDEEEIARIEAANAVKQFDLVQNMILDVVDGRTFRLRPSTLQDMNRAAIEGLSSYAGLHRPGPVKISKSRHVTPDAHLVPALLEDMCDYINDNFETATATHLAAFAMWRTNWIHPFADGNGRTSRAVSYYVLCAKNRMLLPGKNTIPEQIVAHKTPYYEALEHADDTFERTGKIDIETVSKMEQLIAGMLAKQLVEIYDGATK